MLKINKKTIAAAAAGAAFGMLATPAQAQNRIVTEQQILDYGACWGGTQRTQDGRLYYDCPADFYTSPYALPNSRPDSVLCFARAGNPALGRVRYVCEENLQAPNQWLPLNPRPRRHYHQPRDPRYRFGD